MDSVIERTGTEMNCIYVKNMDEPFIIMEHDAPDYRSAVVLLRNLAEKKETTSLEREALSSAVRVMKQKIEEKGNNRT